MSPYLCCLKAAQIGFSTLAVLKQLWVAYRKGLETIYCLPTMDDVKAFVSAKVNRMIGLNPILQEYVRDRDTIEQKTVGGNVIYYRGTMTEREALMIPADLLIVDEEDRANQLILGQYESRLQHSKYQWQWHFSNPSAPSAGVDKYWQISDQKHWFITCPECQEEQYLSWPESVSEERGLFVCKYCDGEITDDARRYGRWVEKYERDKDRKYSGYWIPLLICPWVTAS